MGTYQTLLKEMFEQMVVARNVSLIPQYYHPDFVLYTNQQRQTYEQFLADHAGYYADDTRKYEIEYDDDTFVESEDGLAARVWITVSRADAEPTRLEVILIAKYRDGKLYRLWELTLPNWSTLEAFTD